MTILTYFMYIIQNLFISLFSITNYWMPLSIPPDIQNHVIRQWLAGEARDKIGNDSQLAAGTVSNIIGKWRHELGYPTADSLRQLAIDLKRLGITTTECAVGFRTVNTIKKLGLVAADEEKGLETFSQISITNVNTMAYHRINSLTLPFRY